METLFCNMCTRQYQRKHAYESHVLCCPKLYNGKNMPNQEQLYSMVLELHKKCEKMQNEIRSLKNMELTEKKKVDITQWLIQNHTCVNNWDFTKENINNYMDNSIELLRSNTLQNTIVRIVENMEGNLPFVIFTHKKQYIYIYHDSGRWCEYNFSKIRELYNIIHKELIAHVNNWAESKGESIYSDDHSSRIYNEMIEKVLCGTDDDGIEKVFKKIDTIMRKKINVCL